MQDNILEQVKSIIANSGNSSLTAAMHADFKLAGDALDSMAVTNLILALEEHFGFMFDDEELSVELFETVGSLSSFVEQKLKSENV